MTLLATAINLRSIAAIMHHHHRIDADLVAHRKHSLARVLSFEHKGDPVISLYRKETSLARVKFD